MRFVNLIYKCANLDIYLQKQFINMQKAKSNSPKNEQLVNVHHLRDINRKKNEIKILKFENGSMYQGQVVDNIPDGHGTHYQKFNGKDGKESIKRLGTIEFKYGNFYEGKWKNGRYQGIGFLFIAKERKAYKGYWQDGKLIPQKITIYDYQQIRKQKYKFYKIFEGDYANGVKNGKGIQYNKNGKIVYEGQYKEDCRCGKGIEYYQNGNKKFEGKFYYNHYLSGAQYYQNGKIKYKGGWSLIHVDNIITKSYMEGQGELFYLDDTWYKGYIHRGQRSGKGRLVNKDGSIIYYGYWSMDQRNGNGAEYRTDGTISYQGQWKSDEKNGFGTEYRTDGIISSYGEWKSGKKQGKRVRYDNGSIIYEEIIDNQCITGPIATAYKQKNVQQINKKIIQVYNQQKYQLVKKAREFLTKIFKRQN